MTAAARDSQTPAWIRIGRESVTVDIRARPGAGRSEVLRADQFGLVIAIGAPAEKGKANNELIRMLARLAGVTRNEVSVIRGATARSKSVRIATKEPHTVAARFLAYGSLG